MTRFEITAQEGRTLIHPPLQVSVVSAGRRTFIPVVPGQLWKFNFYSSPGQIKVRCYTGLRKKIEKYELRGKVLLYLIQEGQIVAF